MLDRSPITVSELDAFFRNTDFMPDAYYKDANAHIHFESVDEETKTHTTKELTPMYLFRGSKISAQRLSLMIFRGVDPKYKRRIITTCGVSNCVNPEHLFIEENK